MEQQNEEKKKNGHGGARAGAGRPRGRNNYRSIGIRTYDREQRKQTESTC